MNKNEKIKTNDEIKKAKNNNNNEDLNYFQFIIDALIKPFEKFKKEEKKLNIKNIAIISSILIGSLTIIKLITIIISSSRVTSIWSVGSKWIMGNLNCIHYFKIIISSIFIYSALISAITGIYYLAFLIIKKNPNFIKLLGATLTSFVPLSISLMLSGLIGLISSLLGVCITTIGIIYSLTTIIALMNEIIDIKDKNTKIYFHTICISITFILIEFIAYSFIINSLAGSITSLLK